MTAQVDAEPLTAALAHSPTRGEVYERVAFTFCKAATLILLTQRFALPVASGAAAIFYVLADRHGKKDTRCVLRVPLLIAAFWGAVCLVSLYATLHSLWR
jgi:hypothetical protein